jgi:hypothetical protein
VTTDSGVDLALARATQAYQQHLRAPPGNYRGGVAKGLNAKAIWKVPVDRWGFAGSYLSVRPSCGGFHGRQAREA